MNNFTLFSLASLMLFGLIISSDAQALIGMSGGYANNLMTSDVGSRSFSKNKFKGGYSFAITSIYDLSPVFDLRIDCSAIQKNTLVVRTGPYTGIYHSNRNTYIQIPLLVHFHSNRNKLNGFIDAGPYAAYWTFANIKGRIPDIFNISENVDSTGQQSQYLNFVTYDRKHEFDKKRDNRVEFGWLVGIGLTFTVGCNYLIFVESRIHKSQTDQQKEYMIYQVPRYNKTLTVSIGAIMLLNKKKNA